ncbi:hypothetical protein [Erwinia tasmaniensis]|nr:hypothetical protein [Erwinia tasmaniensis]
MNKLLSLSLLTFALQASTAYAIEDCSKGTGLMLKLMPAQKKTE